MYFGIFSRSKGAVMYFEIKKGRGNKKRVEWYIKLAGKL